MPKRLNKQTARKAILKGLGGRLKNRDNKGIFKNFLKNFKGRKFGHSDDFLPNFINAANKKCDPL